MHIKMAETINSQLRLTESKNPGDSHFHFVGDDVVEKLTQLIHENAKSSLEFREMFGNYEDREPRQENLNSAKALVTLKSNKEELATLQDDDVLEVIEDLHSLCSNCFGLLNRFVCIDICKSHLVETVKPSLQMHHLQAILHQFKSCRTVLIIQTQSTVDTFCNTFFALRTHFNYTS